MRAIIVGAPIELDGEPVEIAQLVELLTTGAVAVEHKHRFRLESADETGLQRGACWCGEARDFQPYSALTPNAMAVARLASLPGDEEPVAAKKAGAPKGARSCKGCGQVGHDRRKCPRKAAA